MKEKISKAMTDYFILDCPDPSDGERALLSHETDSPRRRWRIGAKFNTEPPLPIIATVEDGQGLLIEFWDVPVPLMSIRLADVLKECGVTNIDSYTAEIHNPKRGVTSHDYVAFNLIGKVAMANLEDPADILISRLEESMSAIVIHRSIRQAIEAAGIDTLDFLKLNEWVG